MSWRRYGTHAASDNGYRRDVPLPFLTRDEMYSLIVAMRLRENDETFERLRQTVAAYSADSGSAAPENGAA
jgi:hypothetical protein